MTDKEIPITFQAIPNSDSVFATVHQENGRISLVRLSREDIASLREDIISYYKRIGHLEPDYQPNPLKGVKPKAKPIDESKKIMISAKLYKNFQQLYNENQHMKADIRRMRAEISYLKRKKQ